MGNGIFREKSIDRINSPEAMNDYMKVATPGTWLILAASLILIIGGLCWGFFGEIETRIPAAIVVDDGNSICYFNESEKDKVSAGMEIITNGKTYTIESVESRPVKLSSDEYYISEILGKEGSIIVVPAHLSTELDNGIYRANIVVEKIAPISFVLN